MHFRFKLNGAKAGDILKIRVTLKTKHVERWHETKRDIQAWGTKHGYLIHSIEPIVNYVPARDTEVARFSRKTDAQYIEEYAARRDLDDVMVKAGLAYLD